MPMSSVVAVVVTYRPKLDVLERLLDLLAPQVQSIVIVDNGSSIDLSVFSQGKSRAHVIYLGANRGVATAQNVGIQWARDKKAEYVLLMDQDSEPNRDMVAQLADAMSGLSAAGNSVACVGPYYSDSRHGRVSPFVRLERLALRRIPCNPLSPPVAVDFLIASGCLIPMRVLDTVGGMRDDLFIDYVDVEWCLRAQRDGYQSFGVPAAGMCHALGDEPLTLFGRILPSHSPLRGYYRVRNGVLLLRQPWVRPMWKLTDARRLLLLFLAFSLFSKSRADHFKMMATGLWHGMRGQTGKFVEG